MNVELQNCVSALALLSDGNSNGVNWPLVNKLPGKSLSFLGNDADVDKRVAAYLLVFGLLFGEFSTETLKQVDWQARYEAAEADNQTLKETNSAQAQTIEKLTKNVSALEAKIAALELRLPCGAASF